MSVVSTYCSSRCSLPFGRPRRTLRRRTVEVCGLKPFDNIQSDFVVLGAGIIGLACARALLKSDPDVSVTLLEQADELCSQYTGAATGAGQGYIWMGHRDPKNVDVWKLAARGTALWKDEATEIDGTRGVGYMPQGSLIISSDSETACMLRKRATDLAAEGIEVDILNPSECTELEPLLHVPETGVGLRVATDFQIDARSATTYLLQRCQELGRGQNRFHIHFGCAVKRIAMDCCTGAFAGVTTSRGDVRAMRGAVIAMGCRSAQVIADSFYDRMYSQLLRKRWGLLLEVPYPMGMTPLRHGTMDVSYLAHYTAEEPESAVAPPVRMLPEGVADVSFTACTSLSGNLLLGSSWYEGESMEEVDAGEVAHAIVAGACDYLPELASHLRSAEGSMSSRCGPRPASSRGHPYIGRVPGCSGLVMAAGHEGSGLTMALSTAELVTKLLMDEPVPEYAESFAW